MYGNLIQHNCFHPSAGTGGRSQQGTAGGPGHQVKDNMTSHSGSGSGGAGRAGDRERQ